MGGQACVFYGAIEMATAHSDLARQLACRRSLLNAAINANPNSLRESLLVEELAEREADRQYWEPLARELEALRLQRRGSPPSDP